MRVCVSCFVLLYGKLSLLQKKSQKKTRNFVGFCGSLLLLLLFLLVLWYWKEREREREKSILLCPKRVSCFEHHTLVVLCARRHSITTVRFDDDDETLRTMTTTTTTTRRSVACVVSLRRRRRRRRRDHQNARGVETLAASMQRRHEEKKGPTPTSSTSSKSPTFERVFSIVKRPFARNEPTTREEEKMWKRKEREVVDFVREFHEEKPDGKKAEIMLRAHSSVIGCTFGRRRNEDTLLAVAIISTDCATAGVIESVMVDEASCGGDAAYIDNVKRFLIQSACERLYNADNICDLGAKVKREDAMTFEMCEFDDERDGAKYQRFNGDYKEFMSVNKDGLRELLDSK